MDVTFEWWKASAAIAVGVLALVHYKGRLSYYLKFSTMVVTIVVTATASLPYMIARGKTSRYPSVPLSFYEFVGRHVVGLEWEFVQDDGEVRRRFGRPGSVIVINHQSSLDSFGLVPIWRRVGRLNVVAKRIFRYLGPVGLMGHLASMTFLDRKSRKEARDQLCRAVEEAQATGTYTVVFAEGTRHHDPKEKTMLPFKKGAFAAAVHAKAPIVPVVFSHFENLDHEAKVLSAATIRMHVLEPIDPEEKTAEELMEETRSKMLAVLLDM